MTEILQCSQCKKLLESVWVKGMSHCPYCGQRLTEMIIKLERQTGEWKADEERFSTALKKRQWKAYLENYTRVFGELDRFFYFQQMYLDRRGRWTEPDLKKLRMMQDLWGLRFGGKGDAWLSFLLEILRLVRNPSKTLLSSFKRNWVHVTKRIPKNVDEEILVAEWRNVIQQYKSLSMEDKNYGSIFLGIGRQSKEKVMEKLTNELTSLAQKLKEVAPDDACHQAIQQALQLELRL